MDAKIDEIDDRVFRLSVFVPDIAPPAGFTFNQFLVVGDEPLLFHSGLRRMFPLVSAAVAKIIPLERLRWMTLRPRRVGRVRLDERVAGRRAAAPGRSRRGRLHGLARRPGGSAAARAG